MKRTTYFLITILCGLALAGCSDFLTEESEDKFAASTLVDTPEGLNAMMIAMYSYERNVVASGDSNCYLGSHLYGDKNTDLSTVFTGDDVSLMRFTSVSPTNAIFERLWNARYYEIGRANEIIHYGKLLGEAAELSVAEASFFRAYCYYSLWSRFGRLYLSTEPVTKENLEDLTYIPADSADVFKLMYDDAEAAITNLPHKWGSNDLGRVTKATARHLKALIAAWAHDWDEVGRQVDFVDSELAESGLDLISDVTKIFNSEDYYTSSSTETLYALNFSKSRGGGIGSSGTAGHRVGDQFLAVVQDYLQYAWGGASEQYTVENLGKNWGICLPNTYLMSRYASNDKRLNTYYKVNYTYTNASMLPIYIPVAEQKNDPNTGKNYWTTSNIGGAEPKEVKVGDPIYGRDLSEATKTPGGQKITNAKPANPRRILPSPMKHFDPWTKPMNANGNISFKDLMVYRLSETYLLGAEAYCQEHLNDQAKARYYYNKTWQRACGTLETGDITFAMVSDEHARELAFEGRRYEFLKRNGIWYSQMRSYTGDFTQYPPSSFTQYNKATYGISDGRDLDFGPNPDFYQDFTGAASNDYVARFNIQSRYRNWPIPQSQVDAMAPTFPQNPDYLTN